MGHASRTIKSVKKTMSFMAYVDSCERMIHMKKIKITKAGIKKFLTAHQDVLTCTDYAPGSGGRHGQRCIEYLDHAAPAVHDYLEVQLPFR